MLVQNAYFIDIVNVIFYLIIFATAETVKYPETNHE